MVADRGLTNQFLIDSAGTSAYHEGEPADPRMREHAQERGYALDSLARGFQVKDFETFDYLITMDHSNHRNILALDPESRFVDKIHKMTQFCKIHEVTEVPDPYYDGPAGFELVLDILEDACEQLLDQLTSI